MICRKKPHYKQILILQGSNKNNKRVNLNMTMPKVSQVKKLRKANMHHHNSINDRLAPNAKSSAILRERVKHARELKKIPFFKRLMQKHIILQTTQKNGISRPYILLGVGFKEKGTFRRSVILIDDRGRAIFFARVNLKDSEKIIWLPYNLVQKKKGEAEDNWVHNKVEIGQKELTEIILPLNEAISKNIKEVTFKDIDPRKINQIKRFL